MPKSDQGSLQGRYALIPRTLIFLFTTEKILMLKGDPNKRLWADRYNGLGGHVEPGEDVLTAARRELEEEAGIECEDLWLCGTVTIDVGGEVGVGIFVFRGRVRRDFSARDMVSPEGRLEWVDRSAIMELPLVEDLYVLLPRVIMAQRGEPAFAAHYCYDESGELEISIAA